jgi:phage tail-like protein
MDNGRLPHKESNTYLQYLPAIYQDDPFLGRFLGIFAEVISPIQVMVNTLPERFDPRLAPPTMLERLASWVGAQWPARLPPSEWRQLVAHTLLLHRCRGTKRGLRLALELATGRAPLINEYADGMVLGPDAALGVNTGLAEGRRALYFHVVFDCAEEEVDRSLVQNIMNAYKPAHTCFSVTFRPH